jgi:predicted transcriptional regulator
VASKPEVASTRDELRRDSLTRFLEQRLAEGFRVETRTDTHAIIVPAATRLSFLDRFRKQGVPAREVVAVDANGEVTASPAEPLRS